MATEEGEDSFERTYLYHQLDEYPWDEDPEFQGGLRAILGSVQDPDQVEHLTLRAKCYYYARKAGTAVDFDGYKEWVESGRANASINGSRRSVDAPTDLQHISQTTFLDEGDAMGGIGGDAPKPASFAEICEMIAEGKEIPGIKDIPDTILEGQATESQAATRKKPWESNVAASAAEKPSWMTRA